MGKQVVKVRAPKSGAYHYREMTAFHYALLDVIFGLTVKGKGQVVCIRPAKLLELVAKYHHISRGKSTLHSSLAFLAKQGWLRVFSTVRRMKDGTLRSSPLYISLGKKMMKVMAGKAKTMLFGIKALPWLKNVAMMMKKSGAVVKSAARKVKKASQSYEEMLAEIRARAKKNKVKTLVVHRGVSSVRDVLANIGRLGDCLPNVSPSSS